MITNNITALSWCELLSPCMNGEIIDLVIFPEGSCAAKSVHRVKIAGDAYIGYDHVLLVYDLQQYDVFIILKEGIGYSWQAYKELNDEKS